MKDDRQKAMQLMRDLGETSEKFVDEADPDLITMQVSTKKKISWSNIAMVACAAAVVIVTGLNLPEKDNISNPAVPLFTDTGSPVTTVETRTETRTETVTETESQSESEKAPVETQQEAYVSVTQSITEYVPETTFVDEKTSETTAVDTKPAVNTSEYAYPEDIIGEGNAVQKNSDGSITVTFRNGRFALTLPESWENHFVINGTVLYSKVAYRSHNGGKLISFGFGNEYSHISGISVLRGYSEGEYWNTFRVTDMQYDPDNSSESSEYEKLRDEINSLYYESLSDETGQMNSTFEIPDGLKGEVAGYNEDPLFGYTDSYVSGQAPEDKSRKWTVEKGWHITASRGICVRGSGMYYYCNDTDDNDPYGWISSDNVNFYNENK